MWWQAECAPAEEGTFGDGPVLDQAEAARGVGPTRPPPNFAVPEFPPNSNAPALPLTAPAAPETLDQAQYLAALERRMRRFQALPRTGSARSKRLRREEVRRLRDFAEGLPVVERGPEEREAESKLEDAEERACRASGSGAGARGGLALLQFDMQQGQGHGAGEWAARIDARPPTAEVRLDGGSDGEEALPPAPVVAAAAPLTSTPHPDWGTRALCQCQCCVLQ